MSYSILVVDNKGQYGEPVAEALGHLLDIQRPGRVSTYLKEEPIPAGLRPALILLGLSIPGARSPRTIAVWDSDRSWEAALAMIEVGSSCYLLEHGSRESMFQVAEAVLTGRRYLAPVIEPCPLSPREREVLKLVAEGYSSLQIAAKLGIVKKTVEKHRYRIGHKLGIRDIPGQTRYAIRIGLVSLWA